MTYSKYERIKQNSHVECIYFRKRLVPSSYIALIFMFIYFSKENRLHTGCPRRNVSDFGRMFLMLNYTDITQNTYVQS
jgi:hypothetical protein